MKILVAGYGQYPWFAPAWVEGIRRLGQEVQFFDWSPFSSSNTWGKIQHQWMWGPDISKINSELQNAVRQGRPEILLVHCGFPLNPETVSALTRACWVTEFHHDDPFGDFGREPYFRLFRKAIPFYHSHHVIREENVLDYRRLGVQHVRLMLRYYVPWLHYPRREKPSQKIGSGLGLLFVGHAERDRRILYITDLVESGLPIRLFGANRWSRYLPPQVYRKCAISSTPLLGEDYASAVSAAKICLAFHSAANRDSYSYRVFEIPACGGFLLAERTEVMRGLYEEGVEAEFFESSQELLDKARFYLHHEEARTRIAERGHERCLRSGYDVVSRMKQWLADVEFFRRNG